MPGLREGRIDIDGVGSVGCIWQVPAQPVALYICAHGAGAGMHHGFLGAMSERLASRRIGTLRYQFPYMQAGSRRPDRPAVAHAAVRAACQAAAEALPATPLVAGGKSFGGRMTSQAAAEGLLPGVRGLAFLGFPLHASGRPSTDRAGHLARVEVPMLFLQGTRDALADPGLIRLVTAPLAGATLHMVEGADHSFHVLKRSGRTDAEVLDELADVIAMWSGSEGARSRE